MLIMINSDNNKNGVQAESVRIKRIVLDLQGVIADSMMVFLFEYE